jgi:uncharacterized metal-binding protein YceD (DUF177 family)
MSRKDISSIIRVADLTADRDFELRPDEEACRTLSERLGLLALRKLSFKGSVRPGGTADVTLEARLGATVIQPCSVTLKPVTTRIEEEIVRHYLSDLPDLPDGDEVEMPDDVDVEPLPRTIDLAQVMEEALSLSLPMFPRAEDAGTVELSVTEPGKRPMTDEDARPFAALARLRDSMNEEPN